MGCCLGCSCYDDDQKIALLLGKIPVTRINTVTEDVVKFYVGRIFTTTAPLRSPVSNTPCVYYELVVEQQEETWKQVVYEQRAADFYLGDSESLPVFVPAGTSKAVKFSVENAVTEGTGGGTFGSKLPTTPAFEAILKNHGVHKSGIFGTSIGSKILRYRESIYRIGDTVGILGIASPELLNGTQLYVLRPCARSALSHAYFRRHKWNSFETDAWHTLTDDKCFIGTDSHRFCPAVSPLPPDYIVQVFANHRRLQPQYTQQLQYQQHQHPQQQYVFAATQSSTSMNGYGGQPGQQQPTYWEPAAHLPPAYTGQPVVVEAYAINSPPTPPPAYDDEHQ